MIRPCGRPIVAQCAAALALVEPIGQQDEPMPVVVLAAFVAWMVTRHDRQAHGFRVLDQT